MRVKQGTERGVVFHGEKRFTISLFIERLLISVSSIILAETL
jgi:hypothetical protein